MNHPSIRIIDRKDQDVSINSLFLGDTHRLENESKESNNSGLFDIKTTLRRKLQDVVKTQKEKIKKEVELHTPKSESSKGKGIELVHNNPQLDGNDIYDETPGEKIIFNASPTFSDGKKEQKSENLIDTLNTKLEEKEEEKVPETPDISSISDQREKVVIETIPKNNKTIRERMKKFGPSYSPDTPEEQLVSDDKANDNSDSFKRISINTIPKSGNSQGQNSGEVSTRSKWLDDYLSNGENRKNFNDSSLPSEIAQTKNNNPGITLFDEDEDGKETSEGVDDLPMAEELKNTPENLNEVFATSKNDKSSGSDKDEIPIVSYSDDDKSSDELKGSSTIPPQP